MMFPATGGRIAGAILAAALSLGIGGLGIAGSALAEPTEVTKFKGSKLHLFSEAGKRVGSVNPNDVNVPLRILGVSAKGRFKVAIPGKGEVWILKAQTVTDEGAPKVAVDCGSITESYATSRGFGDCN